MTDALDPVLHRLAFDAGVATCSCGAWSAEAADHEAAGVAFVEHVAALRVIPAAEDVPAGRWLAVGVEVDEQGTTGSVTVLDADSRLHGIQRWLTYRVRGACPSGWTADHEYAHEKTVTPWKAEQADALDRMLVQRCKAAYRLDGTPSYVVEFPVVAIEA